ncbi:MAG: hypothetical protein R3F11_00220 [Verrucomicrobiales bacterium]
MFCPIADLKRTVAAAAATLCASALLPGCGTVVTSTQTDAFNEGFRGFDYCDVKAVVREDPQQSGSAALSCVATYWDRDASPEYLFNRHPPESREGYSIQQLRRMAIGEGLIAFALSMNDQPLEQLRSHIQKGRPVIVSAQLPGGRYFKRPLPILESIETDLMPGNPEDQTSRRFVVVAGEDSDELLLMDPAFGLVRVSKSAFLAWWGEEQYSALLCSSR